MVEQAIAANRAGQSIPQEVAAWSARIDDNLHTKLVNAGVLQQRQRRTLGEFVEEYASEHTDWKPSTCKAYRIMELRIQDFFGIDTLLTEITASDAARFTKHVRSSMAQATELIQKYPAHVVNAIMGHTEAVAMAHYRQVLESDYTALADFRTDGLTDGQVTGKLTGEHARKALNALAAAKTENVVSPYNSNTCKDFIDGTERPFYADSDADELYSFCLPEMLRQIIAIGHYTQCSANRKREQRAAQERGASAQEPPASASGLPAGVCPPLVNAAPLFDDLPVSTILGLNEV